MMDPKTGNIYQVADAEDAKKRGLVSIPDAELATLTGMSRNQRRMWAAKADPRLLTTTDRERIAAAQAKRDRKAARRAAEASMAGKAGAP